MKVTLTVLGYGTIRGTLTSDSGKFELTYRLKGCYGSDKDITPGMEFFTMTGQTLSELIGSAGSFGVSDIRPVDKSYKVHCCDDCGAKWRSDTNGDICTCGKSAIEP